MNKLFFINNIPCIPLNLKQDDSITNPLLDLHLLDPKQKATLSFDNPSPTPLGFKEISKAFSSVIPLFPTQ